MRLDLDKTGPRANNLGGELRPEGISVQTRKMTWLACLAISTQEATFLGLLPPLSSRPHIKHSRRAMDELGAHLRPGFRPKFAVYELMCNFCLVLEEVDGAAAQLSLAETFDGSLSALHRAYAAEWAADVDVLLQYARLMLHATALMRILVEDATTATTAATVTIATATATATATANAAVPSERLADVQVLIIRGAEASERLIAGFRAMIDEASGATTPGDGCGGMEGRPSMPTCYPRYYFEMAFFAAVFTFRTAYMRPSPDRAAAVRGLVEVYNIYRLFPAHPDIVIGADAVHHVLRCAGSGDLPYASAPLGSLVTTNRLGASFVWDTITGLIQLFGGGDEKFLTMKAALSGAGGGERQPPQQQQRQEEGVAVAATTSSSASSSRVSSIDDIVSIDSSAAAAAVMHDANSIAAMHHQHHQHVPEAVTAAAAGGLPLPISLDWGDIDMSLLTFDVFGLEAGEHIAW
ncbi:hypothetical protein SAMD00023353_4001130 [Rosellinia necatrix]|uniref:Uncharacterized protein n=1 Tax=Rosellinia necatrix TaxID=77044 RepID=A0A1W2TMB7_ROSNE|nr:hypothetical protein SAMD00023353_4001130 [Rosellinia necatrix]